MKALWFISKHNCVCIFKGVSVYFCLTLSSRTSASFICTDNPKSCSALSGGSDYLMGQHVSTVLYGCLSNSRAAMVYMNCTQGKWNAWWFTLKYSAVSRDGSGCASQQVKCVVQHGIDGRFGGRRHLSLAVPDVNESLQVSPLPF